MPYIVDGHNLIPKIPGMSLQDLEDEILLVEMLQEYCRLRRKKAEVFFDNAPPGTPEVRNYGRVTARFIRQGGTADQAIHNRLNLLGGEAHNWTVVSSDREVQKNARAVRAKIIPAEEFAKQLMDLLGDSPEDNLGFEEDLNLEEVEDWMKIFGIDENEEN